MFKKKSFEIKGSVKIVIDDDIIITLNLLYRYVDE